jgi:hypothetical protein
MTSPAAPISPHPVPRAFHALAGAGVVLMLALARMDAATYDLLVQEDRFVEWLTVAFFIAAAILGAIRAIRFRALGDGLVALFCIAAAGEEVSWGQRFIGFTPPEVFLANNAQQEANLHNLVEAFGQPKWTLVALLAAYGIVLPIAQRLPMIGRLNARMRMTPPPSALVPWYAIAIALLVVYPVRFTGEWVEALAGALFFVSAYPAPRVALVTTMACAIAAFAGDRASGTLVPGSARRPELLACARAEAGAFGTLLVAEVASVTRRALHRRVWSVWQDDGTGPALPVLASSVPELCGDEPATAAAQRRRYAIDPWGSAYWIRVTADDDGRKRMTVYSFGPNRRRDVGARPGDDVVVPIGER